MGSESSNVNPIKLVVSSLQKMQSQVMAEGTKEREFLFFSQRGGGLLQDRIW